MEWIPIPSSAVRVPELCQIYIDEYTLAVEATQTLMKQFKVISLRNQSCKTGVYLPDQP